jgi:hypothetical protein
MSNALETEMATFRREVPKLLAEGHAGSFALVHGDQVVGLFPSVEAAVVAGDDRFEFDPFLVREVTDNEQPKYFPRNLRCRS